MQIIKLQKTKTYPTMKKIILLTLFIAIQQSVFSQFIYTDVVPDVNYLDFDINSYDIDLNNDEITDISFYLMIGPDDVYGLSIYTSSGTKFIVENYGPDSLDYNDPISSSNQWGNSGDPFVWLDLDWQNNFICNDDTWCEMENKYFGIRVNVDGAYYYGWILMKDVYTVAEYAINTVPNQEIFAGEGKPPFAENIIISDLSNMQDGRDLHTYFEHALNEHVISEYRLIVVKLEDAQTFNLQQANNVAPENYTIINTDGIESNFILSETTNDKDGDLIQDLVSYNVFVLSVADGVNSFENVLSEPSNQLTLTSPPPTVVNLSIEAEYLFDANYNINISFDNLIDENLINQYRIMFVEDIKEDNITLDSINEVVEDNYFVVNKQGNAYNISYANNSITDIYGNQLNVEKEYKAIVVCVPNGNQTNVNSYVFTNETFKIRTVAEQVADIFIVDQSDNNNASDFVVSFPKIETENTISEYRMFIMDFEEEFDKTLAENISSNYYSVFPSGDSYAFNFPPDIVDIFGNNLTKNKTYKAYILSVSDEHFSDYNSLSQRSNYFCFYNPDYIYAGQTDMGVTYIDIVPDLVLDPPYNSGNTFNLDINEDNINDYKITSVYLNQQEEFYDYIFVEMSGISIGSLFYTTYNNDVVNTAFDYWDFTLYSSWFSEEQNGNPAKKDSYIALQKITDNEIIYGWIHISVEDYKKVTIYDYAYKREFPLNTETEIKNNFSLQIYPNPVKSNCKLKILNSHASDYVCSLYDMQGKLCLQETISSPHQNILYNLNMENIPQGIYILNLSNSKSTIRKKIIKQ